MARFQDGCVRVEDLVTENIGFKTNDQLYTMANKCTADLNSVVIEDNDAYLSGAKSLDGPVHVLFQSAIFGFIDDMYLSIDRINDENVFNIQSELRIGGSDFNQNYYHVIEMVTCLNDVYHKSSSKPLYPCR